ncbi:MAG TPA: TIGR03668 family PPOX class F420-dependent oxidoreductase [Candidatus Binataceae bacterium]|nr:TIGR03668 family PPOX class F420-dependent oxidoreductase [Candidatus Binataceae bacterium]
MAAIEASFDDSRIRDFIAAARVAHLATADRKGTPHNVPLCYCFIGESIYFVIDNKPKRAPAMALKRMRNIAENPRVAVVIDHYEEDWTKLAYVLIAGAARIVRNTKEYARAMRRLRAKYPQYRAMNLRRDINPVVRIDPKRVHVWGARFQRAARGHKRQLK